MAWKYVKVSGTVIDHQLGSLKGSFSSSAPPQFEFDIKRSYAGALPQVGEPVGVYRGDNTKIFGGIITNVDWTGFWETSGDLKITVTCVGKMDRMFKRTTRNNSTGLCAEFHSFAGKVNTSGAAVTWVDGDKFTPYLVGKTIVIGTTTYTVSSVTDPDHLTLVFVAGTQTGVVYNRVEYSGYAVKTLLDTFCAGEGFTYDSSSIQDGTAIKSVSFDPPVPVYNAIQQLLDGNPNFFLSVNADGKVFFAVRTLVAAPADFTDVSAAYKRKITISESRDDVRNVEVSLVNWDVVDAVTETINGDGSTTSWFTAHAIGQTPTALLNGVPVSFEAIDYNAYYSGRVNVSSGGLTITRVDGSYFDSAMVGSLLRIGSETAVVLSIGSSGSLTVDVGITGPQTNAYYSLSLGTTGKADFYYRSNDYAVWSDPGTAVLDVGDVLAIQHKPLGANHFETKDATDITARATVETDGTGRIEEVIDRSANTTFQDLASAQTDATNSIARLKDNLIQAALGTLDPGYAVGQLVTLNIAKRKITQTMFIDEVSLDDTMQESKEWEYSLKCISTARRITSADVLRTLFGVSGGGQVTVSPTDVSSVTRFAPDIAGATCSISMMLWAHVAVPVFSGNITLPSSLGSLAAIGVFAVSPLGKIIPIASFDKNSTGWAPGGVIAYSGWDPTIQQTAAAQTGWGVEFVPYNTEYVATSSRHDISGLTILGATITSLTPTDDTTDRWKDSSGSLHAVLPVAIVCSTYPQPVTLWTKFATSTGAGYGHVMHGSFDINGPTTINLGAKPGTSLAGSQTTVVFPPVTTENVTVYAAIGVWDSKVDPTTLTGFVSSVVSVSGMAVPGATLGTNPTVPAGTNYDSRFPYDKIDGAGNHYWEIPALTVTLNGAFADPNVFVINSTFQDYDAAGNPIGPEHIYGDVVPVNGVVTIGKLDGQYGTDGGSYVRTGTLCKVRWRLYASSLFDQTTGAWANPSASALETDVGSGAGYKDITVAVGGVVPSEVLGTGQGLGYQKPRTTAPSQNIQPDPNTGQLVTPNTNFAQSILQDGSFEFATPGILGNGVTGGFAPMWNWGYGFTNALEIKNDGGNSGLSYLRLTGADAQVSQVVGVNPGFVFFIQMAVRSSNTGGAAHAVGLYIVWLDANNVPLTPYTTIVGTVSGYVSAWENPGCSGYVTAPTGAAYAIVKIATSAGELGYWDVDDVSVQVVLNQTTGSATTSTAQLGTGSGTAAFRATATTAHSEYGAEYAQITNSSGYITTLSAGGLTVFYPHGTGGVTQINVGDDASQNVLLLNSAPVIAMQISGVFYAGYTGTVQAAYAANKPVKGGVIMN